MQSVGGFRLFDGFFVGDHHTSRDQQFILLNQITLVVNLTNAEIPNYFQHYDIRYFNVDWKEINQNHDLCDEICERVSENFERFQSVLVHGLGHLDQPITVCAIYMMNKFRWSLYKTLEYLQAKINDLAFTPPSFHLLKISELKLLNTDARLSYNWEPRPQNDRELVLRNTFLNCRQRVQNSKNYKNTEPVSKKNKDASRRVSWIIKQKPSITQQETNRVERLKTEESSIRQHIILSVRKLIAESNNKENRITDHFNKQINRKIQKMPVNKLTLKKQPSVAMKKYKSFYSLASLQSFEKLDNPSTQLTDKNQSINLQNTAKFPHQTNERTKTEKSETINENTANYSCTKTPLMKTQNNPPNIEIHLTRTHSERFSRKASLHKSQKQHPSISSKISLRKPSTNKKYQLFLNK